VKPPESLCGVVQRVGDNGSVPGIHGIAPCLYAIAFDRVRNPPRSGFIAAITQRYLYANLRERLADRRAQSAAAAQHESTAGGEQIR